LRNINSMDKLEQLQSAFAELPLVDALHLTAALFPGRIKFSSSLGQEDQVLTHVIATNNIAVNIFTIDTGRLFNEAYELLDKTIARYNINIDVFFPQAASTEAMVSKYGINLFYGSVENRKLCCDTRKVEPLVRALQGAEVWITGLRSAQTDLRKNIPVVEWLGDKKIYKINPLLNWSYSDVKDHLAKHAVPYNPLHDKGFISIGCAPCTRAVEQGEDPRTGRWWWEASQKECGLHLVK
jgi:phosphoadenosine phosphosulfate reductase